MTPADEEFPFEESWFDEDSAGVGDDLTMTEVFRQMAGFWGVVLLLAALTALVSQLR